MPANKTYTAIHLLDKVFEFTEMTPDSNYWSEEALISNLPRLIRFQQIEALLKAFAIHNKEHTSKKRWSFLSTPEPEPLINFFLQGGFIKKRTIAEYVELIQFIEDFALNKSMDTTNKGINHIMQLVMPFQQLIAFKKQVRSLLAFNSRWLEASSITSSFSITMTNSIAANLNGKYNELDIAIEMFINPGKLCFTEYELISNYGFPKADLTEIDIDFT